MAPGSAILLAVTPSGIITYWNVLIRIILEHSLQLVQLCCNRNIFNGIIA